jgi:hypothetical protein
MELDYERCKYPIPDHLAIHILDYISATQHAYQSNIDVLFYKHSQFAGAKVIIENDKHYTYANLRQCLSYFYRNIVQDKYSYIIATDCDSLLEGKIQKIQLDDMRHIAMVSLALNGGSPARALVVLTAKGSSLLSV